MVTTSICARIGVPTCCEHAPHTSSATVKPQVTSEDIILARVRSLRESPDFETVNTGQDFVITHF